MNKRMTSAARAELADAIRARYLAAQLRDKRKILEEFIAVTGYHEKSAIRVLNSAGPSKRRQSRQRASLYDEAVRAALVVLWEASDRVCGKRSKALLPILLPALERNGHLKLDEQIRPKVLSMSAATVDRLLRVPRTTGRTKRPKRVEPEPRRRIKMRTFADWNDPPPGSMEMDLVAHCGRQPRQLRSQPCSDPYRQRVDRGCSHRRSRRHTGGQDARSHSRRSTVRPASVKPKFLDLRSH